MATNWTPQQQSVIDDRDHNLLVSAAAGSGKTAVLVERIIRRITDGEHPLDIDRLLIVTFTKAAASEMRERILGAIEKLRETDPDNERLERQQTLIHNAQITTIDSFCLFVIRNYFEEISLDPGFRVADTTEVQLIEEDVLAEVFEEYYGREGNEDFLAWVDAYSDSRSDAKAKEMIRTIYHQSESSPWPREWIAHLADSYLVTDEESLKNTQGVSAVVNMAGIVIGEVQARLEELRELSLSDEALAPYTNTFEKDLKLFEHWEEKTGYDDYYQFLNGLSFSTLGRVSKPCRDENLKLVLKKGRDDCKDKIKTITKRFFQMNLSDFLAQVRRMRPVIGIMVEVALAFSERMAERKREKRIIDFSDIEHMALNILVDEETKEYTQTALTFRSQFDEVMIDEYQDSNQVQEAIMQAISGQSEGERKLFMVGDVKQSIYRFRLARPELFMEKYETFSKSEDAPDRKISLRKNFRSRMEILEFTNNVFAKIMQPDLGNVAYDEDAALYLGADYPDADGMRAEILLYEAKEDALSADAVSGTESGEAEIAADPQESARRSEGRMIARRILSMKRDLRVTGKDGALRPVKYGDIVILLRSTRDWDLDFQEVLAEYGIPVIVESTTGYFSAVEVQTVLSYLQILDNPLSDIPMAAVLRSPIVGLSEEELADIRIRNPKVSFAKAALIAMREAKTGALADFAAQFFRLRASVCDTPIHELILRILKESGYGNYAAAMPAGKRRADNLGMLVEKAAAYEKTSYKGLFHFMRYIEQLRKYDVDYGEADNETQSQDAVRIMTIHKSKGLEFPVVFVSGIAKSFNKSDQKSKMVIHSDLGIGLVERKRSPKRELPSVLRNVIAEKIETDSMGEELRVLYVALTRAKEKLILTGSVNSYRDLLARCRGMRTPGVPLLYTQRYGAKNYLDWILSAVLSYPNGYEVTLFHAGDLIMGEAAKQAGQELDYEQLIRRIDQVESQRAESLSSRLDPVYPFEGDIGRKNKYSVSELKHDSMLQQYDEMQKEAQKPDFLKKEWESYIPEFAREGSGEGILSDLPAQEKGTFFGTAVHRIMECMDFAAILVVDRTDEKAAEAFAASQIAVMKEREQITEEMASLVRPSALTDFVKSDIAQRMARADAAGKLYREKPFVMEKDGVLIQGIIDVFWLEEDKIVLLDYKTDRVDSGEELVLRYRTQLALYADALSRIFSVKGKALSAEERLIYSFRLKEVINV